MLSAALVDRRGAWAERRGICTSGTLATAGKMSIGSSGKKIGTSAIGNGLVQTYPESSCIGSSSSRAEVFLGKEEVEIGVGEGGDDNEVDDKGSGGVPISWSVPVTGMSIM